MTTHDPDAPLTEETKVATDELAWDGKSLDGLSDKMLFRNAETGATICLIRFAKGTGIPTEHIHASNQFMFMLSGKYAYTKSGIVLEPGDFYANATGHPHGPTEALEDTVFLEIYDGPHYPERPDFYDNDDDAR